MFKVALFVLMVLLAVGFVVLQAKQFGFPIHWYLFLILAYYEFIFMQVPEPYFMIAVRFGGVRKIMMSKSGHKIDENGDIVMLSSGEPPESSLPGGLHLLGWPGIDRVYTKKLKFLKSLPNGEIKEYNEANVSMFYARVDYPYALPFVECEDKNNLPIGGHGTLLAHIVNPRKAIFDTANFYETMVGLVLPVVRECFEHYAFDEIKEKADLDRLMWDALTDPKRNPQPGSDKSVVQELRDKYGVVVVAFRIVNIKPPEEFRKATLTKWMAERKKDAAVAVADEEYERVFGPVQRAKSAGINEKSAVELRSQSLAGPNFTYTKSKVDITSADEKIDPNIAGLIGGAKAIFGSGGGQGKGSQNPGNPGGQGSSNAKRRRQKGQGPGNSGSSKPMDDEDEDEEVF